MTPFTARVLAGGLLLASGLSCAAAQGGGPVPYEGLQRWNAGEACAFPVELQASSKIKVRLLGAARVITTFAQAETTFVNLSNPSKSITIRGGGAWHDTVHPDGSILGRMTGHSFVVGGIYQVSLFIGDWTVVIRADGHIEGAPVGSGRQINLCDMIA